jgi:hypothetical protein
VHELPPDSVPFQHREPLFQRGVGAVAFTPGIRLPPGSWFQFCGSGACSIRYVYGGITTTILATSPAGALSIVLVHPGPNVYIQAQAAVGVDVMFLVGP